MTLSNDLNSLADRLARLAPSHRDPFRFHEEKSELVHELRKIADQKQNFVSDRHEAAAKAGFGNYETARQARAVVNNGTPFEGLARLA